MFKEILLIITSFFSNIESSKYVKKRAESQMKYPYESLPDIIHNNLQPLPFYYPDRFMYFLILWTLLNIPYLIQIITLIYLNKHLLTVGLSLCFRSIVMHLTIMPSCIPKNRIDTCLCLYDRCFLSTHDLMFSGHTILYIFFSHILNNNLIQIIGPFLSIASRQHYTIDVFVSFIIYYFINQNL